MLLRHVLHSHPACISFFSLGSSGVNCIALFIRGTPRRFFQMLQNTDFFNLGGRLTVVGINPQLVGVKVGRKGKFIQLVNFCSLSDQSYLTGC